MASPVGGGKIIHIYILRISTISMLMTVEGAKHESESIRDVFPFEPERDEDGSLMIAAILGRRLRKTGQRFIKPAGMMKC